MTHPGDSPNWKPSNLPELLAELDRRERKYGTLEYSHNEVKVRRLPDGTIVLAP